MTIIAFRINKDKTNVLPYFCFSVVIPKGIYIQLKF